ncbi:DMT family transporter [Treponema parvum]|uniref:DMT family transporter n=1 Tax=Treponema parvum TaxID=138851 RepID=UPI001AEC2948|nr:DMT family transporter [Treponema parvum]QTQ17270.1 DMT family transporter [Treponema parvum]
MFKTFNKNRTITGIVLALISIFFWGITFVCTKYLLRTFSSLEVLIFRFFLAYCILWCIYPHPYPSQKKKHEFLFAFAGLFGVTVYQFMENIAIEYTSASNVSIIVSICPIFTAVIAQIFLHEKHLSFKFFAGFALAIWGIALVSFNGKISSGLNPKGDVLALIASVSWGFYSLFMSKINELGYSSVPATRKIFFYALLFMLPIASARVIGIGTASMDVSLSLKMNALRFSDPLNWFGLLFLGILASGFCFVAWSIACRFLGTVRTTVGLYLIPVVTITVAFFALHEPITVMGSVGAALTITGLFVSEWKAKTKSS